MVLVEDVEDEGGAAPNHFIDAGNGTINLAVYQKPNNDNELILFLIHTGKGRSHSVPITINSSVKPKNGQAWLDFDRKVDISVSDKGILQVPDFAHSCIVTLNK